MANQKWRLAVLTLLFGAVAGHSAAAGKSFVPGGVGAGKGRPAEPLAARPAEAPKPKWERPAGDIKTDVKGKESFKDAANGRVPAKKPTESPTKPRDPPPAPNGPPPPWRPKF